MHWEPNFPKRKENSPRRDRILKQNESDELVLLLAKRLYLVTNERPTICVGL
jgi:hypothetical protein